MAFVELVGFSTNHCLNSGALSLPLASSNRTFVVSRTPTVSRYSCSLPSKVTVHHTKLKHPPRASAEGIPGELIDEDSKFVPLNADDSAYGPPALLLLGFQVEEAVKRNISENCY